MRRMYLDIETTIDHPSRDGLLLVGWAIDDEVVTVRTGQDAAEDHDFLELLADPEVVKVEHTKYDARYLLLAGFDLRGPIHDTSVMAYTMNENTPLDIEWLAWRYAGVQMDKRLRRSSGRVFFRTNGGNELDLATHAEWSYEVWAQFTDYNARDVATLRDLYRVLWERMEESEWLPYYLAEEVPYTGVLARMETRGLPVNLERTAALAVELRPEADRLAAELLADAGLPPSFNLNSGDQLAAYLFSRVLNLKDRLPMDMDPLPPEDEFVIEKVGRLWIEGHWTVKGRGLAPTPPTLNKVTGEKGKRPSTSSPELLFMHASDDWVRKLCTEYRKLEKLLTTYLTKWPVDAVDGRLYGRFNQTGTVTGRLSSSGPNLQNIPARGTRGKQIRGLFEAVPGTVLVVGDYDQLEMRLMAHFSEDRQLLRIFREGRDPHTELAYAIFGENIDPEHVPAGHASSYRDAAKTLNYAMGYGAGPKKVAQTLSLLGWPTTADVAKGYLAEMSRYYRGLFTWKTATIAKAKRKGNVRTIGGHRRRLRATFKDTANWKLVGYGERQAVNSIVQGSAADILRRAMVRMDIELASDLRMLAQVHDELVFEAPEYITEDELLLMQDIAQRGHGFDLRVPLLFVPHVGHTWASAKSGADTDIIELLEAEDGDGD